MASFATEPATAWSEHGDKEPLAGNYFIAAYPPFSAWTQYRLPDFHTALRQPPSNEPLGLYVHLPFCQKKCDYCYYLSFADQPREVINGYLSTMTREAALYAEQPMVLGRPLRFAYFGGGTPSMLSPHQLRHLSEHLRTALDWSQIEEVTFECAPRSVRPALLEACQDLGVTRLSMGVQSFDDSLLKLNGRVHLASDVLRAYALIRRYGFDVVNLDLMAGLIGETPKQWKDSVSRVIDLNPDSVTIYQTEIPYNTQLYRDWRANELASAPPSWAEKQSRLAYGFSELERAGYKVVSAYQAVKDPHRHAFLYQDYQWKGADLIALGVASFGYVGGVHYQNAATLQSYQASVADGKFPVSRAFALNPWDRLVRELVLQVKLGRVSRKAFLQKFGIDIGQVFASRWEALEQDRLLARGSDDLLLLRPGLLKADRIARQFYDSPYQDVRYT